MSDKRKHPRIHTNHLVSYTKFSAEELPEIMGMGNTVDVSESGVKLTTKEPMEVGESLHLDFVVDGEVVKAEAKVVHCETIKHYSVGLYFEGLTEGDRERLKKFLAKHAFKAKAKDD